MGDIIFWRALFLIAAKFVPLAALCFLPFGGVLRVSQRRFWPVLLLLLVPCCVVMAALMSALNLEQDMVLIGFALIGLLLIRVFVTAPFTRLLFVFITVMQYGMLANDLAYYLEAWLSADTFWAAPFTHNAEFQLIAYALTLPFVIYLMVKKVRPAVTMPMTSNIWNVLWTLPLVFTAMQLFTREDIFLEEPFQYAVMVGGAAVGSYFAYFIVFRMIYEAKQNMLLSESVRHSERLLALQSERYEEIAAHTREIKTLRHDMRHHLAALNGMLSEHRYKEATSYLRDYAGQMEAVELPLCECYVVDVIARRFKAQAEAQGIHADFQLVLPEKSGVTDTDLCIVLGNLMENAIHACAVQERGEKFLRVLAKAEGPDVFISVDNSCAPDAAPEGSGLGISSVQAVAKKYSGFAKFDRQGNEFNAAVLMYRDRK